MDYRYEQVCEAAQELFKRLKQEDFITLSKHDRFQEIREEKSGLFGLKKKKIVEWVTEEKPIVKIYVLRKSAYLQFEYGYQGYEKEVIYYGISDSGKLICVSARTTVMQQSMEPDNYTVAEMTEDQMKLFNYRFEKWEHKTDRFIETGFGSKYLPIDRDPDNRNRFPYKVLGLRPGRICTGVNEGIYLLLQFRLKELLTAGAH